MVMSLKRRSRQRRSRKSSRKSKKRTSKKRSAKKKKKSSKKKSGKSSSGGDFHKVAGATKSGGTYRFKAYKNNDKELVESFRPNRSPAEVEEKIDKQNWKFKILIYFR